MCGIAGMLHFDGASREVLLSAALRMAAAVHHRGPDDGGVWADSELGIALAHRRLAIVERTELGRQPMTSACGRYVTVFNGEIYNFRSLRTKLSALGHKFSGGSDTEVLLSAVAQWGLHSAISHFIGMFAF